MALETARNAVDCLIVFNKITDATTSDGNFFNQVVVADIYNNTSITDRDLVSRVVNSSNGTTDSGENALPNGLTPYTANFATNLVALVSGPDSSSLNPLANSPAYVAIVMNCPPNDNATDPVGLFVRSVNIAARNSASLNGAALPALGTNMTPAADTFTIGAGNILVGANFVQPTRIDGEEDSAANAKDAFIASSTINIVFTQDNHLWTSVSSDGGKTWSYTGGKPTPLLIDQELSASGATVAEASGKRFDSSFNNLHASGVFYTKPDANNNVRMHVRFWN